MLMYRRGLGRRGLPALEGVLAFVLGESPGVARPEAVTPIWKGTDLFGEEPLYNKCRSVV